MTVAGNTSCCYLRAIPAHLPATASSPPRTATAFSPPAGWCWWWWLVSSDCQACQIHAQSCFFGIGPPLGAAFLSLPVLLGGAFLHSLDSRAHVALPARPPAFVACCAHCHLGLDPPALLLSSAHLPAPPPTPTPWLAVSAARLIHLPPLRLFPPRRTARIHCFPSTSRLSAAADSCKVVRGGGCSLLAF